jgi:hypothetical protein
MLGPHVHAAVAELLDLHQLHHLRQSQAIIRLAETYGEVRLDAACQRALDYGNARYRTIKTILEKGLEPQPAEPTRPSLASVGACLRGPDALFTQAQQHRLGYLEFLELLLGQRQTDWNDYPPEKAALFLRNGPCVRESFWTGRAFGSLDDINTGAERWCLRVAGARDHGTTHTPPLFQTIEQPAMLALPTTPFEIVTWARAKVARDCHVEVQSSVYSIPWRYVDQMLDVRLGSVIVRLYAGTQLVKTHLRGRAGDEIERRANRALASRLRGSARRTRVRLRSAGPRGPPVRRRQLARWIACTAVALASAWPGCREACRTRPQ